MQTYNSATCQEDRFEPITFDAKVGILITDEMDAEIDRLLPDFKNVYPHTREKKGTTPLGNMWFVNPYTGHTMWVPVSVVYDTDPDSGHAWVRNYRMIAVNAAKEEILHDYLYRRLLAHELIHVVDPENTQNAHYCEAKDDYRKYCVQPVEFNAFSGMIAYSIRKNAKTWKGTENHDKWVDGFTKAYELLKSPLKYMTKTNHTVFFDNQYANVLVNYQGWLPPDQFEIFIGRIKLALDDGLAYLKGETVSPLLPMSGNFPVPRRGS